MSVSGHVTSSSLLPMSNLHLEAIPSIFSIKKENVNVVTLDTFLDSVIKLTDKIFMKIDVQGFEMNVLNELLRFYLKLLQLKWNYHSLSYITADQLILK